MYLCKASWGLQAGLSNAPHWVQEECSNRYQLIGPLMSVPSPEPMWTELSVWGLTWQHICTEPQLCVTTLPLQKGDNSRRVQTEASQRYFNYLKNLMKNLILKIFSLAALLYYSAGYYLEFRLKGIEVFFDRSPHLWVLLRTQWARKLQAVLDFPFQA